MLYGVFLIIFVQIIKNAWETGDKKVYEEALAEHKQFKQDYIEDGNQPCNVICYLSYCKILIQC